MATPETSKGSDSVSTLLPAGLLVFALTLGVFGTLSYGIYSSQSGWGALTFFGGLIVVFGVMISLLKRMFQKFTGRIVFALWLIAVLGSYFIYLFQTDKYPMGIDLAGGTELTYRLDYKQIEENIERINQQRMKETDPNKIKKLDEQIRVMKQSKNEAPEKAAEVVRRRVDPTGTKGIPVTTLGTNKERLRIQLPKATDAEVTNIKNAIQKQGHLTFHIVTEDQKVKEEVLNPANKTGYSKDGMYEKKVISKPKQFSEKLEMNEDPYVINRKPEMDGSHITLARAEPSHEGSGWEVTIFFDPEGTVQFARLTTDNEHKPMGTVLDGVLHSVANIREPITQGVCRITGNFTQQDAEELARVLQAGSLPAEVVYESEYTVGPSLGSEQIYSGMLATVIGTIAVIIFMIVYYRLSGVIAAICMLLNLPMLIGAMGFFKATLTLPGIAGIVLTLGMAVDANVLIIERMREELQTRKGSMRLAVSHGFDRAFHTIIDCHLTTLISSVVLYYMGTGPVRGFAVSLTLGILTTLFCNLWLNWLIMDWLVARDAISNLKLMQFFKTTHIDFMGQRRIWMGITGTAAVLSVVLFFARGDAIYDVDFTGGARIQFNFAPGHSMDEEKVKQIVDTKVKDNLARKLGEKYNVKKLDFTTQSFDKPEHDRAYRRYTVTTQETDPKVMTGLADSVVETFGSELEPPAISESPDAKAMLIRFNDVNTVSQDKIQTQLTKKAEEAPQDDTLRPIQAELAMLKASAPKKDGIYLVSEVSPLPADPKVREQVETVIKELKLDNRIEGPISGTNAFGSQVAGEMKWQALGALILANIGVFIYLWFRFEFSGAWGFGAIVALIHDTVIAAGAVALANMLGFPIKVNLNIVAALLTIVGYSVNDTIVVFDRIREVKQAHPTRSYEDIVNEAVNATLSRTVLTALTVLLADLSLLIFGGPSIKDMAYTLFVGFGVGMYSSIFIASPLMIWWYRKFGAGAMAQAATSKPKGEAPAAGAQV